ncbi:MAG: hypothetical protein HBSAPP03_22690 [Phycisphaerae bacterium]|nr:MAG: hypothetical protein HBSAPP03_22690 [Phycisphaerae bacterium]
MQQGTRGHALDRDGSAGGERVLRQREALANDIRLHEVRQRLADARITVLQAVEFNGTIVGELDQAVGIHNEYRRGRVINQRIP